MAAISLITELKKYSVHTRNHLMKHLDDRVFLTCMAPDWFAWMQTKPIVPDLRESPTGWYKKLPGFWILGEGCFIKTLYTIYSPGQLRPGSTDLDVWTPVQNKSKDVLPTPKNKFQLPHQLSPQKSTLPQQKIPKKKTPKKSRFRAKLLSRL